MAETTDTTEMDFWGHLGALRTVLFKIALVVIIAAVALFIYMPWIFDHIVLAPCDGSFVTYHFFDAFRGDGTLLPNLSGEGFHLTLINYELTAQLNTHVSLAFWGAVVLCFPFIIYMLWTFVAPGLYPHERKSAVPAFVFGNIMFFLGILCC
ncbi:MAG: twin-arginine translocase subunit TatC [Muribaculaceae bacterium]|nr:twin-arginine translocase subunit TatC [Muribaculaceae bacterium]